MERFATWPHWGWKEMPMGQLCVRSSSDSLATSHLPAKSNSRTFPMAWQQPQRSRQWAGSNTPYFAAFATCGSCTRCLQTHQASFAPVCLVRRPPTMSTASWAFPATWEGRPLLTLRSRRKNLMQKLLTEGWQWWRSSAAGHEPVLFAILFSTHFNSQFLRSKFLKILKMSEDLIKLKILFEDLFGHTTSELLTRTPFPKCPGRGFQACSSRTDSQDPLGETGPTTPSRHWGPLRTSWASRCCLMKQTKGQVGNSVRFFSLYTELSDFSGYHQEDVTTC